MKKIEVYLATAKTGKEICFSMTLEDAHKGCHQGYCDRDCKELQEVPYIRRQLAKLSLDEMIDVCIEYGIDGLDDFTRDDAEQTIIWLAAGNINESYNGHMVFEL